MSWAGKVTKTGADTLVRIASGEQPIKALDESKTAFRIVLGIAAVTVLTTGVFLTRLIVGSAKLPVAKVSNTATNNTLAALKDKDTDEDGLNDYEELYVYGSSPYLLSSASDGVSDGDKVKQGVNPNCQAGKTCTVPTLVVGSTTNNSTSTDSTVSISFLRQALIASGASATAVQTADDATILQMYQQATKSSTAGASITTNGNANTNSTTTNTSVVTNGNTSSGTSTAITYSDLESMTGAEIRSLLTTYGIDATNLSQVDDTTLKAIFTEAISGS